MATYVYEGKKINMKKAIKLGIAGMAFYGAHVFMSSATKLVETNKIGRIGLAMMDLVYSSTAAILAWSTVEHISCKASDILAELKKEEEDE